MMLTLVMWVSHNFRHWGHHTWHFHDTTSSTVEASWSCIDSDKNCEFYDGFGVSRRLKLHVKNSHLCQTDKHEPWSLYTVHSDSVTNFMLKTFKKTDTYSNIHTYIRRTYKTSPYKTSPRQNVS
jgi:hypothetical protein